MSGLVIIMVTIASTTMLALVAAGVETFVKSRRTQRAIEPTRIDDEPTSPDALPEEWIAYGERRALRQWNTEHGIAQKPLPPRPAPPRRRRPPADLAHEGFLQGLSPAGAAMTRMVSQTVRGTTVINANGDLVTHYPGDVTPEGEALNARRRLDLAHEKMDETAPKHSHELRVMGGTYRAQRYEIVTGSVFQRCRVESPPDSQFVRCLFQGADLSACQGELVDCTRQGCE